MSIGTGDCASGWIGDMSGGNGDGGSDCSIVGSVLRWMTAAHP